MSTNIARGPRGAYAPGRGDMTGRKFVSNSDEKAKRDLAMKVTRNALQSEPTVLVDVPGGRSFLIPREAFNEIVAQVEEQVARSER